MTEVTPPAISCLVKIDERAHGPRPAEDEHTDGGDLEARMD